MITSTLTLHWCILSTLSYTPIFKAETATRMNSVSSSIYACVLYQETGNAGKKHFPPFSFHSLSIEQASFHISDPPTKTDPAKSSAAVRQQISADITSNGIFPAALFLAPVEPAEILSAGRAANPHIFDLLFGDTNEYTNPFSEEQFLIWAPPFHAAKEHVFACPVRSSLNNDATIFPYYVSKEYNVGPFHEPYAPGRFVFGSLQSLVWHTQVRSAFSHVMLAEQPAKAFHGSEFNIEEYYFRLRKQTRAGTIM